MDFLQLKSFSDIRHLWEDSDQEKELISQYTSDKVSFIPYLLPEDALNFSVKKTIDILVEKYGKIVKEVINTKIEIESPVKGEINSKWITKVNMVGINVRIIDNFFNIIKYALTIPVDIHNSIHLLPIWESGVVESIYGTSSWNLNPMYFSSELHELYPLLDSIESQLKFVINLLHLMGFTVGMDVIPHTDRFSEIVISNPSYFEWLQRKKDKIINHSADLHEKIEEIIYSFLKRNGSAINNIQIPETKEELFSLEEEKRNRILFGEPQNLEQRINRRVQMIKELYEYGFETAPATMGPPYRGLIVKNDKDSITEDSNGMEWRNYHFTKPESFSRAFGPLTRYKLYERKNDNKNWEINFSKPRVEVFEYICKKYAEVQRRYNFDFMRGDMSHVQMRPSGVPEEIETYYDPLKAVKNWILKDLPFFAYYAESFLSPPNIMAYGDEIDHLEATDADVTLGDLQSLAINNPEFSNRFRQYLDIQTYRKTVPCFTMITSDKDDPRFDSFYLKGNEVRYFMGIFLPDTPSYYGLGYEQRDPHSERWPNEYYTKLFVFHEQSGNKKTAGKYIWGKNVTFFLNLVKIRLFAEKIDESLSNKKTRWLLPPDPLFYRKIIVWTTQEENPEFLFIANLDVDIDQINVSLPEMIDLMPYKLELTFSIPEKNKNTKIRIESNGYRFKVDKIEAGGVRIYKILK